MDADGRGGNRGREGDHADRGVRRLVGAIGWNLTTWWFGLPSSSSPALIGGIVGATLAAAGTGAVEFADLLSDVLVPAVASP
jgi:PiT family inorganic phosphate transporter